MALYDYTCSSCGRSETVSAPITAGADAPACCATKMKRQWSPVGIAFRGGGFYRTDASAASRPRTAAQHTAGR